MGATSALQTARSTVVRISRRVAPHAQRLLRFSLHRPFLAFSIYSGISLFLAIQYFHWCEHTGNGRWYYNWALTKTPASLVRFIPKGDWGEPTDPPRWVPEIYDSRWMGEWEVPPLSRPVWRREDEIWGSHAASEGGLGASSHAEGSPSPEDQKVESESSGPREEMKGGTAPTASAADAKEPGDQGQGLTMAQMAEEQRLDDLGDLPKLLPGEKATSNDRPKAIRIRAPVPRTDTLPTAHPHTLSRRLKSPAIIKFHVFSTAVSEKSYTKRQLIRRLSPMYQIPPEYRHLVDIKFVMGYNYLDTWGPPLNETMESKIREEEREYGDILRLPGLWRGENLRDGKILQWIRDVGEGKDGRDAWYLFKVDDDAVINLPKLLDLLLSIDIHEPTYLGTSLNRWPSYHNHFTGMLTGFNYGLYKTLSQGISKMKEVDVQAAWDDDVLTGEIMYSLPPAPPCRHSPDLPECDPHRVPEYGWMPLPENPDPRTALNRYDFERRAGDPAWVGTKGDLGMHGWWFKFPEYWEKEWARVLKGLVWEPPAWLGKYADLDA